MSHDLGVLFIAAVSIASWEIGKWWSRDAIKRWRGRSKR